MSICCVCKSSLDNSKGRKRQKKLNGKTFATERCTLARCVETRCGVSIDDIGLMDSGCTACYECAVILGKISKYIQEIENLTDQVVKNFLQYNTQNPTGSRRSELPQHPAHASVANENAPKRRKVSVSVLKSILYKTYLLSC